MNELINTKLVLSEKKQFKSKNEVFELISKTINNLYKDLDPQEVIDQLLKREEQASTGVGDNIAVPHASIGIDSPKIIVIRLEKPMDWDSIDGKKVNLIIAILVPKTKKGREEHFRLLTNISRNIINKDFSDALKSGTPSKVVKAFEAVKEEETKKPVAKKEGTLNVVAITSCATGIAHTYMAAEAIESGAEAMGVNVKVEKRGAMGSEDKLTSKDIQEADICIIASEVAIDPSIFVGKKLYVSEASEAIKLGDKYISKAIKQALTHKENAKSTDLADITVKGENETKWKTAQRHMLFGVSWMLPLVVVSGIMLGLVNIITSIQFAPGADWALWDGNMVMQPMIIFGQIGFGSMFAVFSAAVAYSIAGKPAAMPGFIAGMMITNAQLIFIGFDWTLLDPVRDAGITGGFFGAIFTGMFVGWAVNMISKIKLHRYVRPLMPVLIIPLFLSLFMFFLIKFVVGLPLALLMYGVFWSLEQMAAAGPAVIWIIGGIFGALCMFDLGGPVNKTAYAVAVALFIDPSGGFTEIWQPYAAFHMAIPIASLGAFFAVLIRGKLFSEKTKIEAVTAASMGSFGISEGSIPIAISNPKVWLPANMIGGFVAGSLIVLSGVRVYGGVAGPFLMILGSMDSVYDGAYWTVFILWPLVTVIGSLTTAFIAILLTSLEAKRDNEDSMGIEKKDEPKKLTKKEKMTKFVKEELNSERVLN